MYKTAVGRDSIDTPSARTYIYSALIVDSYTRKDNILVGNGTKINVCLRNLITTIGHDAVLAKHEYLSCLLNECFHIAAGGVELMFLLTLKIRDYIVKAAFP